MNIGFWSGVNGRQHHLRLLAVIRFFSFDKTSISFCNCWIFAVSTCLLCSLSICSAFIFSFSSLSPLKVRSMENDTNNTNRCRFICTVADQWTTVSSVSGDVHSPVDVRWVEEQETVYVVYAVVRVTSWSGSAVLPARCYVLVHRWARNFEDRETHVDFSLSMKPSKREKLNLIVKTWLVFSFLLLCSLHCVVDLCLVQPRRDQFEMLALAVSLVSHVQLLHPTRIPRRTNESCLAVRYESCLHREQSSLNIDQSISQGLDMFLLLIN